MNLIHQKLSDFARSNGVAKPVRVSGGVLRLALERPGRYQLITGRQTNGSRATMRDAVAEARQDDLASDTN